MPSVLQTYGGAAYRMYCQLEERVQAPASEDPLTRLSATAAAALIRDGNAYIDRIKLINPYVNAVVELFEHEALRQAEAVDEYLQVLDKTSEEFKKLPETKPLLGVPVSIKHSYALKGKRNVCGLVHRRNMKPCAEDAAAVKRIREAGGIPHCYTNVPPGCMWIETNNKVYGTTSSPYDNRTTCGGSSGGEGSIISAEGSVIGIGSDLGGSLRIPAIFNGIFSLKPVNSVPLEGHYPDAELYNYDFRLMGQAGPLARYAEDMKLWFNVLSQRPIPKNFPSLKPGRIFVSFPTSSALTPRSEVVRDSVTDATQFLAQHFQVEVENLELAPFDKIMQWYMNEIATPTSESPAECLLPNLPASKLTMELIKTYLGVSKLTPGATTVITPFSTAHSKDEYVRLHQELISYRSQLYATLGDSNIMLTPGLPRNHYFHHEPVIAQIDWFQTGLFNVLAVPVAIAPLGLDAEGYPRSVQVVGGMGSDYLLIRIQEVLSERFGGWQPPKGC